MDFEPLRKIRVLEQCFSDNDEAAALGLQPLNVPGLRFVCRVVFIWAPSAKDCFLLDQVVPSCFSPFSSVWCLMNMSLRTAGAGQKKGHTTRTCLAEMNGCMAVSSACRKSWRPTSEQAGAVSFPWRIREQSSSSSPCKTPSSGETERYIET